MNEIKEEVKMKEATIPKDKKLVPLNEYKDTGIFHPNRKIAIPNMPNYFFRVAGLITGCGAAQIQGVSFVEKGKVTKEEFLKSMEFLRNEGAGCIICTLGDAYYVRCEEIVLAMGFELIAEYTNYRHSICSTQRMYMIKL